MKLPLRYLLPGILALGVVLLFSRGNRETLAKHELFDKKLDRLEKLDEGLNRDVLKSRFHLLADYDVFAAAFESLRSIVSDLAAHADSIPEPCRRDFTRKLEKMRTLLDEKERLIELFKSENAVLNNSLRYLPMASNDLLNRLREDAGNEALSAQVGELMQRVFVHTLLPGDEEEFSLRESVEQLQQWKASHPKHLLEADVAVVVAHVKSVVNRKSKVESLTQQILDVPSSECLGELQQIEAQELAETMRQSDLLQHALEGISVLLLLGIGYSIWALQVANRTLERRVEERTKALRDEASGHRRTAEERDRFFAASLDLLTIGGVDGYLRKVNPSVGRVLGWTAEELLSNSLLEFVHPDDRALVAGTINHAVAGEPVSDVEVRCLCKDGGVRWISWTTSAVDGAGLFFSNGRDITERKRAEAELERVHQQLVDTSRQAGMAEVATGVLHNVGNVLNSVNVSATLIADGVKKSKVGNLGRVVEVLDQHAGDLGTFLTSHTQGKNLPGFLRQLHDRLCTEQKQSLEEVESLRQNIEHIKEIVSMQQEYARVTGFTEILQATDLVEDSLRLNAESLSRHGVAIERQFQEVPAISVEKHKVLQILVNLIGNAKLACDESGRSDKRVTVSIANGEEFVRISVSDNGIGIPAENLTRIFNHGFTTRKDGHGFGLHSGALAAREMGGALRVESRGPGAGATFTLELPVGGAAR